MLIIYFIYSCHLDVNKHELKPENLIKSYTDLRWYNIL